MFKLFGKKNPLGVTARNSYLDNHGYYLAMEKHRCIKADEHSAPQIPYVLFDLLNSKIEKSMACCVRWDIYTYRWGLHTFKRTSSCRIALKKKDSGGHRHFVRDGEQSAEQLQSTTMDPEKRLLRQITIENAAEAERTFSMLMGDDVPPRREFIEQNAHYANIDA